MAAPSSCTVPVLPSAVLICSLFIYAFISQISTLMQLQYFHVCTSRQQSFITFLSFLSYMQMWLFCFVCGIWSVMLPCSQRHNLQMLENDPSSLFFLNVAGFMVQGWHCVFKKDACHMLHHLKDHSQPILSILNIIK